MAPVFIDYLRANDVPEVLVQAFAAGAAAGVGGALGGSAGAAAGFNEATNNAVVAVPLLIEVLVAAGETAILACVRSPKCVAVIGATALNALTSNNSQNQDGSGEGSGPAGGNQADTYGTPPNGASPPPDDDPNKPRTEVSDRNAQHIFRDAEGHLPDTPANRELLENVANNAGTRLGVDKWGNAWHASTDANGSQVWVQVRGGRIVNGGVNNPPRNWNSSTGLSSPTTPGGK